MNRTHFLLDNLPCGYSAVFSKMFRPCDTPSTCTGHIAQRTKIFTGPYAGEEIRSCLLLTDQNVLNNNIDLTDPTFLPFKCLFRYKPGPTLFYNKFEDSRERYNYTLGKRVWWQGYHTARRCCMKKYPNSTTADRCVTQVANKPGPTGSTPQSMCSSSPCKNGGTCVDKSHGYTCTCAYGYTGSNCATGKCSFFPCKNGGTCVYNRNGYACTCANGYTGRYCDTGCLSGDGRDYVGTHQYTAIGRCLSWLEMSKISVRLDDYPESGFPDKRYVLAKNYCRNPKNEDGHYYKRPWCYTSPSKDPPFWDYCINLPLCIVPKDVGCYKRSTHGYDYKGKLSKGNEGGNCVYWKDAKQYREKTFFEKSFDAVKNYCRNPGDPNNKRKPWISADKPWCYVSTDRRLATYKYPRWEFCDVPTCEEDVGCHRKSTKGYDYQGTLSIGNEGGHCVNWKDAKQYTETMFYERSFDAVKNYCRNPGDPTYKTERKTSGDKPWCYVSTDRRLNTLQYPRFEWCNVPICKEEVGCYKKSTKGYDYKGKISKGNEGGNCAFWKYAMQYRETTFFEKSFDAVKNYCRNPGDPYNITKPWFSGDRPWCYVSTDQRPTTYKFPRFEYCDVPICKEEN